MTAEGWADAGAEADLDIGFEDGKFKIGGEVGAAVGLGVKSGEKLRLTLKKL